MEWFKNRTIYRYAAIGFLAGFAISILGLWLEINKDHLSYVFGTFLYIQRTQPLIWIIDLAPLVIGVMAGIIGSQRQLTSIISKSKKEWETVFELPF